MYQFNWQVRLYAVVTATTVNAALRKNGLAHQGERRCIFTEARIGTDPLWHICTVQIAAGDEIDVYFVPIQVVIPQSGFSMPEHLISVGVYWGRTWQQ